MFGDYSIRDRQGGKIENPLYIFGAVILFIAIASFFGIGYALFLTFQNRSRHDEFRRQWERDKEQWMKTPEAIAFVHLIKPLEDRVSETEKRERKTAQKLEREIRKTAKMRRSMDVFVVYVNLLRIQLMQAGIDPEKLPKEIADHMQDMEARRRDGLRHSPADPDDETDIYDDEKLN